MNFSVILKNSSIASADGPKCCVMIGSITALIARAAVCGARMPFWSRDSWTAILSIENEPSASIISFNSFSDGPYIGM